MERAYSVLDCKAVTKGEDSVTITGIASTPTPDRYGDVVDPMGAKFVTPMPLLWQHSHVAPVGTMNFAKPTKTGIPFEASLPIVKEAGRLQDRVNEAIHSLQYGLVSAVSIGFSILENGYELMENGGLRIKAWEWLELSLVTIPANADAVISAVKSVDRKTLAALGRNSVDRETLARMRNSAGGTVQRRKPILLER